MKKVLYIVIFFITASLFLASSTPASARVSVRGYYKSNGTYVQPYYRSSPNVYKYDNYSYSYSQPRYNTSYSTRSYSYSSPLYTPDYSYTWNR